MASSRKLPARINNFSSSEYRGRCKASLRPAPASASPSVPLPPPELPVIDDDQPSKWRVSPLRILILVLLAVFAVWYQLSRDDAARDAQQRKDKAFYDKRAEEDNRRSLGEHHF
jgi:hypothetical protein